MFGQFDCRLPHTNILLSRKDLLVRTTIPHDWKYIDMLMKHNAFAVGFLQRRTWDDYVWGGQRNFMCFI